MGEAVLGAQYCLSETATLTIKKSLSWFKSCEWDVKDANTENKLYTFVTRRKLMGVEYALLVDASENSIVHFRRKERVFEASEWVVCSGDSSDIIFKMRKKKALSNDKNVFLSSNMEENEPD